MDNFDLKKYLIENKVTNNSKMVSENTAMNPEAIAKKIADVLTGEEILYIIDNPNRLVKTLLQTDKAKEVLGENTEDETGYGNVSNDELMKMYNEMATNKYNMSIHVANQFVELEKEARSRGLLKNFDNFPNWF